MIHNGLCDCGGEVQYPCILESALKFNPEHTNRGASASEWKIPTRQQASHSGKSHQLTDRRTTCADGFHLNVQEAVQREEQSISKQEREEKEVATECHGKKRRVSPLEKQGNHAPLHPSMGVTKSSRFPPTLSLVLIVNGFSFFRVRQMP